jgi:tetratricopeptide (TPR) repeat protein
MVDETLQQVGITMKPHPVPVHHYGNLQQQKKKVKQEQYLALGLKKLADRPDDVKALYELAVQAAELEQYATAEQLWIRLLGLQSDFVKGWFNLGFALLRQEKLQESLEASDRALALDPALTDALINRTICEICLCSGEQAYQVAMQAQQRCPDHPALLGLAALALYRIGKATEGRLLALQLHGVGMDCRELFCGIHNLLQQRGDTREIAAVVQAVTDASSSAGVAESTSSCS